MSRSTTKRKRTSQQLSLLNFLASAKKEKTQEHLVKAEETQSGKEVIAPPSQVIIIDSDPGDREVVVVDSGSDETRNDGSKRVEMPSDPLKSVTSAFEHCHAQTSFSQCSDGMWSWETPDNRATFGEPSMYPQSNNHCLVGRPLVLGPPSLLLDTTTPVSTFGVAGPLLRTPRNSQRGTPTDPVHCTSTGDYIFTIPSPLVDL